MRRLLTISWMLIATLALLYGMWFGYDALQVSLKGNSPKKMTLEEVERNGIGDARYVEITGMAVYPRLVFEYPRGGSKQDVVAVYYPLVSPKTLREMLRTEKPKRKIAVVVRRDDLEAGLLKKITEDTKFKRLAPWLKPETIRGVTQHGLRRLPKRVLAGLNRIKLGNQVSKDVIFIRKDQAPLALWIPILILCGCLFGLVTSYFFGIRQLRRKESDASMEPIALGPARQSS